MKKYVPEYLKECCRNVKINHESDGGFELNFQIADTDCSSFCIYKTKNRISPCYADYIKKKEELYKKYDSFQKKGYMFGTKSTKEGRVFFGCSKGSEFISLEDITELEQQLINDRVNVIIKAVSPSGNRSYELFNSCKNGFDAAIACGNEEREDIKLKKSKCKKCGNDTFEILIKIHNTGRKDLLEEKKCDKITDENWTNAFDWITIEKRCATCGNITKNWFEWETM